MKIKNKKTLGSIISLLLFIYFTTYSIISLYNNSNNVKYYYIGMIISYLIFDRIRNYYIKPIPIRIYNRLYRIIRWFPILWKQYDFDYIYALDVFKFQLKNIKDHLNSKYSYTENSKHYASRIDTILKLMEKVYNEDYSYIDDEFNSKYPKRELYVDENHYLQHKYEGVTDSEEIIKLDKIYHEMFLEGIKKHEKAHKILWKLIEHNIRNFWS